MKINLRIIQYAVSILGTISLLLTTLAGLAGQEVSLIGTFWEHPYLFIAASVCLGATLFLPLKEKTLPPIGFPVGAQQKATGWPQAFKILYLVVLATLGIFSAVTVRNELEPYSRKEVVDERDAQVEKPDSVSESAASEKKPEPIPKRLVIKWAFDPDFSSHVGSVGNDGFMTIVPDTAIVNSMIQVKKASRNEEPYHSEILALLRKRAEEKPNRKLLRFFTENVDLLGLASQQFGELSKLNLTLDQLKATTAREQKAYLVWMRKYMGQWFPLIRISIQNNDAKPLRITGIVYEVSKYIELEKFMGGSHGLNEAIGFRVARGVSKNQWKFLESGSDIVVPPGEDTTLNLILSPSGESGRLSEWQGTLSLDSSLGSVTVGSLLMKTYNLDGRFLE
jgi:hypothetical protein